MVNVVACSFDFAELVGESMVGLGDVTLRFWAFDACGGKWGAWQLHVVHSVNLRPVGKWTPLPGDVWVLQQQPGESENYSLALGDRNHECNALLLYCHHRGYCPEGRVAQSSVWPQPWQWDFYLRPEHVREWGQEGGFWSSWRGCLSNLSWDTVPGSMNLPGTLESNKAARIKI